MIALSGEGASVAGAITSLSPASSFAIGVMVSSRATSPPHESGTMPVAITQASRRGRTSIGCATERPIAVASRGANGDGTESPRSRRRSAAAFRIRGRPMRSFHQRHAT